MKGHCDPEKFLAEKRLRKKLKRKVLIELRAGRTRAGGTRLGPRQLIFSDSLLGFVSRRGMGAEYTQKVNDSVLVIPERFSIIADPDAAIGTFNKLVGPAVYSPHFSGSFIDHSKAITYDLAAEYILGKIASEIERAYTMANKPLRFSGRFPSNIAETRLLTAIGIVKLLGAKHSTTTGSATDLEIFQAHRRQGAEEIAFGSRDRKSNEIVKFVDHIDNCLRRNGRTLTAFGRESLAIYTGEVLANAEEHSKRGEWLLAGYLDNSSDEHMCEIVVVSFGDTFAESFRRLPISSYAWVNVQPYLEAHVAKRIFTAKWEVDDLLALVALQGGISCKNTGPLDTRGKGTVDLIRFFEAMHRECSSGSHSECEMAIITGRTYIKFDGTHSLRQDSTGRDVIAFNQSNALEDAPDPKYVRRLENKFPGTIISMRFSLQPKFTEPAPAQGESPT
jgi:hypothetical protein